MVIRSQERQDPAYRATLLYTVLMTPEKVLAEIIETSIDPMDAQYTMLIGIPVK